MYCRLTIPYIDIFFFLNDPPPTDLSPLSLPAPLPICPPGRCRPRPPRAAPRSCAPRCRAVRSSGRSRSAAPCPRRRGCRAPHRRRYDAARCEYDRSEEHTSELQSQSNLVCRLLLEKKKTKDRHRAEELRRALSTWTSDPAPPARAIPLCISV